MILTKQNSDEPATSILIVRANASYSWLIWALAEGAYKEFLSYSAWCISHNVRSPSKHSAIVGEIPTCNFICFAVSADPPLTIWLVSRRALFRALTMPFNLSLSTWQYYHQA